MRETDRIFEEIWLDAHIPGLVYGIVIDGLLVHVKAFGVQDIEKRRPVTADTLFRIASMTKSFTALSILKLRDEGRLSLDAPVEDYLPEMRNWQYPTEDSPRIRVRDLLSHTAGLVTDDPWGDRQTPMPQDDFTSLLRSGVAFTRAPGTAMEYSNLGYAILGRVVQDLARQPYKDFVRRTFLIPLGMTSSGYDIAPEPTELTAVGYRWEDDSWKAEPILQYGAFSAMGGLQTTANDYSRYVAWLLAAWPARDGADAGPVKRGSVRELAQGENFPQERLRPSAHVSSCHQAYTYGMGWGVALDCDLGVTLGHGGGYPGYGSYVLLLPEYGAAVFVFANRTYAGVRASAWDAAVALQNAGVLRKREETVSTSLLRAYTTVARIYDSGSVTIVPDTLAMNFLLDRSAEGWARDLAKLKAEVGSCETDSAVLPTGALSGEFTWRCEHGRVKGSLLLAPVDSAPIQSLTLTRIEP